MIQQQKTHSDIAVSIAPHPFAVERVQHTIPYGQNLRGIIYTLQPDPILNAQAHVYLNDTYIPQDKWHLITPKPNTHITIRMIPAGGGGGKNPLRTVLSLAVMAAAPALTAGISASLGVGAGSSFLGISAGRLITTGVNLLGRLAINAIAPPGRPKFANNQKQSPTLFIQGAKNQVTPFGRIPKILGKHRFVPPLGALPYTETVGDDQYLRMLFVWGYGPLKISDLKIGETPLSEFDDVEIETRFGYDTDTPLTLYSNSVIQNDLSIHLTAEDGFTTRTTEAEVDEISVDMTFPRGLLAFKSNGRKKAASVAIKVQYAPTGTENWSAGITEFKSCDAQTITLLPKPTTHHKNGVSYTVTRMDIVTLDPASGMARTYTGTEFIVGLDATSPAPPTIPNGEHVLAHITRSSTDDDVITDMRTSTLFETAGDFNITADTENNFTVSSGGLKHAGITVSAQQSFALRRSISFKVPKGQYDVRLRRITPDSTDDNTFDNVSWTALRSIRSVYPVHMNGLAMTAIRIKATDQLNGIVDRLNGVVECIIPDWNGTTWENQPTSNPASLFRHVLQGVGNEKALTDNRLDLNVLQNWHERCDNTSREFNVVIDYDISVREILQDIAAAGRASPTVLDGKWAIVEDKAQSVPIQHFTPHNTFRFQGQKTFDDLPHALRVRFINREKGWLQDERIVYDTGYNANNATQFETLELTGITSPDQAWKDGRYHIATARLRPETYHFYCDLEHIVCTRGDLIRFTHDVPLFGLSSGRIKSLNTVDDYITTITLTDDVTMENNKSYSLRIRKSDGSSFVIPLQTTIGASNTITPQSPINTSENIQTGDLFMFGESGTESVELIVKSIEPQNDLQARITAMDASPAIHTSDTDDIPPFQSQITIPNALKRPETPVLKEIQSGAETLTRNTDGSLVTRILVTLSPTSQNQNYDVRLKIKTKDSDFYQTAIFTKITQYQYAITDVEESNVYDIQIQYINATGIPSSPLQILNHTVSGTSDLPRDVENFTANIVGQNLYLSWDHVSDLDLSHYIIKYTPQMTNTAWQNAVTVIPKVPAGTTSVTLPAATGTYFIKAVDVGARQSENATSITTNIASILGYNAVLDVIEDGSFTGTKNNTLTIDNKLRLDALSLIDDIDDIDDLDNWDVCPDGLYTTGSYLFANTIDLGHVYTSRLSAELNVTGIDLNNTTDLYDDIDLLESWDQNIEPSLWDIKIEIRTTSDDPEDDPTWSTWQEFIVGDYTARAFQCRLTIQSHSFNITPEISKLRLRIDMPDRLYGDQNITSNAMGSNIDFFPTFRATPVVAITAHNMNSGDYYTLTDITQNGFTIQFFDNTDTGITRTFDYLAKGYGENMTTT